LQQLCPSDSASTYCGCPSTHFSISHPFGVSVPSPTCCSEIKERSKKQKTDKAQQKLQAKAAGGKAVKNMPKGGGKVNIR
jgi:hypothetical protein